LFKLKVQKKKNLWGGGEKNTVWVRENLRDLEKLRFALFETIPCLGSLSAFETA